jgi:hypothetical protein
MRPLTSSLLAVALIVLLAAGCAGIARTPDAESGDSRGPLGTRSGASGITGMAVRGDVAEVLVTAERPDWVMPEVVVRANRMPEIVVRATSVHPEMAL